MRPQAGPPPACHDLPSPVDLRRIPWLGRPCREHGDARVLRAVRVGPMALGCLAVGPGHGRVAGLGDDALGDPAARRNGPHVRADPVGPTLGPGGVGRGVAGGPQDRHTHDRLVPLTAGAVDDGEALTGVIPTERLTRTVSRPPDAIQLARPGSVGLTTPTVRHACRRGGRRVLPPQQHGDTRGRECVVPRGPLGHRGRGRSPGRDRRPQPPLQGPRLAGRGARP